MLVNAVMSPLVLCDLHPRAGFQALKQGGEVAYKRTGSWPKLLVVVLPNGPDAQTQVRYITAIELGVRIQCAVSV